MYRVWSIDRSIDCRWPPKIFFCWGLIQKVVRPSSACVRTYFVRRRWSSPHPATGTATPRCATNALVRLLPVLWFSSVTTRYIYIYTYRVFIHLFHNDSSAWWSRTRYILTSIHIHIYKFNSAIIISKIVIPVAHRCYYWRNHHHRRRLLLPSPPLPPLIFHHTFVTTSDQRQRQRRYIHPPKKYDSSATTTMSRARYVLFVGMYWSICPPTKNETKCRSHCDILYLCIILSLFLLLS